MLFLDLLQQERPALPADKRAIHRKNAKAMARKYKDRNHVSPVDQILTSWAGVTDDEER